MRLNRHHQLCLKAVDCALFFQANAEELREGNAEDITIMLKELQNAVDFSDDEFKKNYGIKVTDLELKTPGRLQICHLFDGRLSSAVAHHRSTHHHHYQAIFLYLLRRINTDSVLHFARTVDVNYSLTRHDMHDGCCFFMTCLTGLEIRGVSVPRDFENHLSFRTRVCEQLSSRRDRRIVHTSDKRFSYCTWLDVFCQTTIAGIDVMNSTLKEQKTAYDKYVHELRSPLVGTGPLVWLMSSMLMNDAHLDVRIVVLGSTDMKYGEGRTDLYMCMWGNCFYGMVHNGELREDDEW